MNLTVNGVDLHKLPKPYLTSRPDWIELYDFTWKLAAKNVRECNGRRYMDCAWDLSRNYQWTWDTCFTALYGRYGNRRFPCVSSLDNFYRLQRKDGFISMTYDLNTGTAVYGERINPPLFAWVEWEYYLTTGDSSRFADVVPKIEKLMDWINANRRSAPRKYRRAVPDMPTYLAGRKIDATGTSYPLYFFTDCGSSGMDDSPRTPRDPAAGKFFDWIDLSSQMVLSFRRLSNMHRVCGSEEKADGWERRAAELADAINRELWCENTGFYHDRSAAPNFVNSKTIAGFWPMLAGIARGERMDALAAQLQNEKTFKRPLPVPTLAADDCNYCPNGTYWIGGVWAPTNYMVTRGLMWNGYGDLAHEIAGKYLDGLAEVYRTYEPHSLWEAYCAEHAAPALNAYERQLVKPDFVGWTGIGPVAMLIENILGLELNVPENRIDWHLRLKEPHGIRDLRFGEVHVDLHCEYDATKRPKIKARVTPPKDIEVRIFDGKKTQRIRTGTA